MGHLEGAFRIRVLVFSLKCARITMLFFILCLSDLQQARGRTEKGSPAQRY